MKYFIFPYICRIVGTKSSRNFTSKSSIQSLIMDMKKDFCPTRTKQKTKYSAANVSLQVLGSGAKGSPASLYVFSDQSRYLFNCGEGTQRLAHEHKMKLSKLEHIFITHSSWKNFGGLPGMCLTLQDSGVSEVVLHGPPLVDDIFWATKRFVVLRDLTVHKADQSEPFEDSMMRVDYAILKSTTASHNLEEKTLPVAEEKNQIIHDSLKREHDESSDEEMGNKRICRNTKCFESVGYICHLHARPGTLQLAMCEAQGVPLGPLLGQLKAGKDITLPNGKVVRSCDVTTPEEPGPVFIVLECPDASYIPSLLDNPKFAAHQTDTASNEVEVASIVIHFTPPDVVMLPEYQEWMNKFPPSTMHLMLNEGSICHGTTAVHRIQHKLNLLHPSIFPLLHKPSLLDISQTSNTSAFVTQGGTLDKYYLRPRRGFDKSNALEICAQEYVNETMAEAGFPEELGKLKETLNKITISSEVYPRITFLGTGSCIPNKTRNTSGILLEITENQVLLLDCGEGTYGQLIRLLGEEGTQKILRSLQAVFISHLHADHHIGLVGILQARQQSLNSTPNQNSPPLLLLAPQQIMSWLNTYDRKFEAITDQFQLVSLADLHSDEVVLCEETVSSLGLTSLKAIPVCHCPNAFGIVVEHVNGWKMVYSGDTEPCDALIEGGQNCDLLIHEATMEDGLEEEARKKKHSTTSEAIDVGQKMNAKFTLLTHFSQRYAKIPLFNDKFSNTVGIAFDNMRVSLSELPILPLLYPALRTMFNKYYEEMEQKTRHHQLRQIRKAKAVKTAANNN